MTEFKGHSVLNLCHIDLILWLQIVIDHMQNCKFLGPLVSKRATIVHERTNERTEGRRRPIFLSDKLSYAKAYSWAKHRPMGLGALLTNMLKAYIKVFEII